MGARRGAIDAWEKRLLANRIMTQDAGWYTDNGKYRRAVTLLFQEWEKGREEVSLEAQKAVEATPPCDVEGKGGQGAASAAASGGGQGQVLHAKVSGVDEGSAATEDGALQDVAALHAKFFQDPNFQGRKGKFAGVDAFDAGIERQVHPRRRPHPSLCSGVCAG